jgi:hypothetical protein
MDLHADSPVTRPGDSDVSARVAQQTMRRRRRRVVQSVLWIIGTVLIMIVLTVLTRDEQDVESCRQRFESMRQAFQAERDEGRGRPMTLPLTGEDAQNANFRSHVYYNYFFDESARPVVGVCCCNSAHDRLFQPAGRFVVLYDVKARKYELKWMEETEFAKQAAELGMRLSVAH